MLNYESHAGKNCKYLEKEKSEMQIPFLAKVGVK